MEEEIYDKALEMGLRPRRTPKGYSILCPLHEDNNHSAIVYRNDGWAQCFAGCGRWRFMDREYQERADTGSREPEPVHSHMDYYDEWLELQPIDTPIKGIPASHLNKLGWRKLEHGNILQIPGGVFIPAFDETKKNISFFQVRHEGGPRRFSFPSGAEQIPFGLDILERCKKYVPFTEGNSDRATLELAGIPAVALPSGSSGRLLRRLADYCRGTGKILVSVSDNDAVGDKLLADLGAYTSYIDARVRGYKDINEAYLNEGLEWVIEKYKWLKEE